MTSKQDKILLAQALEEKARRLGQAKLARMVSSFYDWQKRFNAATKLNRACALIAANQVGKCVLPDTMIDTDNGAVRIDALKGGELARSYRDGEIIFTSILKPFSKGEHDCFTLKSKHGEFSGADFHRVLVCGQWLFLSELHALYEAPQDYVGSLLRSIAEPSLLAHVAGVEHSTGTVLGYPGDCSEGFHQYDAPPHGSQEFGQASFPSQADALKRILVWFALGDLASRRKHTLSQVCARLSSLDDQSQIEARFVEFLFQDACKLFQQYPDERQACELLDVAASDNPQLIGALLYQTALDLCEKGEACLFSIDELNPILSCASIGRNEVYDMTVPETGTYIAHGFIHHNTRTGTAIDAMHLTGDYPDDWDGYRFDRPPLCWLLGYSGEKTRDLMQNKLFGRLANGEFEGGLIPADRIVDYKSMTGTSGACREVRVRHKKGIAVCQFWSYSQGQHAMMGDVVDWYHIDEEPEDQEIYPQVVTRTLNGDGGQGGRGILTLTPENGKTELVCKFMDEPEDGMYLQTATWDDAPHLTEEIKKAILAIYPAYQRDMRSRGVPLMGAGLIFEHSKEQISCPRFEIPGHFFMLNGCDFGWDHPQAHIQIAVDPDSATVYVTQAWKGSKKQPFEAWQAVKGWAYDVPTAWPHDGNQHEKGSAKQQKDYYEEAGWNMLDEHAKWPDGGNGVEAGLMKLNELMLTGKFKVFDDLWEALEEIREYHRKQTPNGLSVIVKKKDDIIDAIRTAFMMLRFAERKQDIRNLGPEEWEEEFTTRNAGPMGY